MCHAAADHDHDQQYVLEVDLGAFKRGMPRMRRTKTIGQGVDFLNRHLSSSLSRDPANGGINGSLFQYLKTLTYAGTVLLLYMEFDMQLRQLRISHCILTALVSLSVDNLT